MSAKNRITKNNKLFIFEIELKMTFLRLTLLFLMISSHSFAQVIDSSFYEWTVYEIQANELEPKTCYIISYPNKSQTNHNSREKPYIMITKYQKDNREEFSVYSGFNFKRNSEVFITSDNVQFKIFAKENIAWPKTKYEDAKLIETMLRSANLNIRSDSDVGTYAVDNYSLKGITKAYLRMKEICK